MPFSAAKVQEAQIALLLAHRVSVDPKSQRRVAMAELPRDPANTLARREGEARERVPRVVQPERAYALSLGLTAQPAPRTPSSYPTTRVL